MQWPAVGPQRREGRRAVLLALAACVLAALTGCGVNPVTGKKEIQLISESQEVRIGAQNYLQSIMGDIE